MCVHTQKKGLKCQDFFKEQAQLYKKGGSDVCWFVEVEVVVMGVDRERDVENQVICMYGTTTS